MDIFVWSTIALSVWGAFGPLVGVRYGQDLARRWQREQWVRENRKQECRDVLKAMTEYRFDDEKANYNLRVAIDGVIFTQEDMQRLQVHKRWRDMTDGRRYRKLSDKDYDTQREVIMNDIRNLSVQ